MVLVFIIPYVLASPSTTPGDFNLFDSGDLFHNGSVDSTGNDGDLLATNGYVVQVGPDFVYNDDNEKLGNMSISGVGDGADRFTRWDFNGSNLTDITCRWTELPDLGDADRDFNIFIFRVTTAIGWIGSNTISGDATHFSYDTDSIAVTSTGMLFAPEINFTMHMGKDHMVLYANGTELINDTTQTGFTSIRLHQADGVGTTNSHFDDIRCWDGTITDEPQKAPAPDLTPPEISLINLSEEGGIGQVLYNNSVEELGNLTGEARTNSTSFTMRFSTTKSANCAMIGGDKAFNYSDSITYDSNSECPVTGGDTHICTLTNVTPRIGLYNSSVGCKDLAATENEKRNGTKFTINITDPIASNITLFTPSDNVFFDLKVNDTGINFTFFATDNVDRNFTLKLYINNILNQTNSTYRNGTNVSYLIDVTEVGTYNWTVNATDSYNNINQSDTRSFTVKDLDINITLNGHSNNSLIYSATDVQFNFTVNTTEEISQCNLFINNSINQSNQTLIVTNVLNTINHTNLTLNNDYIWTVGCNRTDGAAKNSTDIFSLAVYPPVNVSFAPPTLTNDTTIISYFLINVSTKGRILNYTLELNGVNESITFNTTLNLLINKTVLDDLTTYTYKVYVNDSNGNSNQTETRTVNTNFLGLTVEISTGVNFIFRPFIENATLRIENISCDGQNQSVGCLNLSNFGPNLLNFSLKFNITQDSSNQRIIEDFTIDVWNWTTFQLRSNNTQNKTVLNTTVACGEVQSLNESGLFEYRFNNTLLTTYKNASNGSVMINTSMNCTNINYYTRILNGTQKNISGYDYFNFTFRGDNTTNRINISLIDEAGTIVSSISLSLENEILNRSGMALGALKNISKINISVMNVSGTDGLNGFFLDEMRLTNITSNQSGRIKMKASCTGHYHNASLLIPAVLTNMCLIPSGQITKYIWLYQDINLTEKGMAWRLKYNASIV